MRPVFDQELAEVRVARNSEISVIEAISEAVSKLSTAVLQGLAGLCTGEDDGQSQNDCFRNLRPTRNVIKCQVIFLVLVAAMTWCDV